MYRKDNANQLKFKDFYLPFSGQLRSDNRWVVLSKHGQPAKVPHIRMQLALDAEDQHQNITDNNNEVLNVAYSASPKYANLR